MSGLATALRTEITRVAQRETKNQLGSLREEMVGLKKQVKEQAKLLRRYERTNGTGATAARAAAAGPRLTAASIRRERKRLGLTQAEFARLTGVTPVAVYFWESGRTKPSGRRSEVLLEVRGWSVRDAERRLRASAKSKKRRTAKRKKVAKRRPRKAAARRKRSTSKKPRR